MTVYGNPDASTVLIQMVDDHDLAGMESELAEIRSHTTRRQYNALVWGPFKEDDGTIEGNIGRHPKDRLQMAVYPVDSEIGKPAITHYHVLERFGAVTLVECRLETGRTHQIRAHMRHLGHPLFADERYGGDQILRGELTASYKAFIHNCMTICPRQALHAKTLGFVHPTTGEEMFFDSELPADMTALLDKWRKKAYPHPSQREGSNSNYEL